MKKTIPEGIEDPFYRYWREEIAIENSKSKIELKNIETIMEILNRDLKEFEFYLKKHLKRSLKIVTSGESKLIEIPNKSSKVLDFNLENLLEKYICEYVICDKDKNPETYIEISDKIIKKCKSCGNAQDITDVGILSEYYQSLSKKNKKNKKKGKNTQLDN